MLQGVFRGLGDTKAPLYATLAVSAANIALCPALIFGAGWGVPGAALATVFAEVLRCYLSNARPYT
jgi:Na+-driven multidrug efflux pump